MKTQLLRQTKKSFQLSDIKQLCSQNLRVRNLNKAQQERLAVAPWWPQLDDSRPSALSHLKVCSPTSLGGWCLFTSGNETPARLVCLLTAWGLVSRLSILGERETHGNHIALYDLIVEVIRPSVCCGASYKDQPGFQVHLIQLAISWKQCGTGNMTLVILENTICFLMNRRSRLHTKTHL